MTRRVAVFDVDLPPAVAIMRSLGRAGVPVVAMSSSRFDAGRSSRFHDELRSCPPVRHTDEFVGWLTDEMRRGAIDLIAPTSDYLAFCVAEAIEKLGGGHDVGHPAPDAVMTCLFKDRFSTAMANVGFPTPPTATPATPDEAQACAADIGFPVVLKPRSHAGLGVYRGSVARTPAELARQFRPYAIGEGQMAVERHDPDLALPIVQHYHDRSTTHVISVSGCLDRDGELIGLSHSRKVSQSPRRLGTGTMFEPAPRQPFTDRVVHAVRMVQGSGIFEMEVLVDRTNGDCWTLDLNPRAFGQISLDIALGVDLPVLWYNSVTGSRLGSAAPRRRRPLYWHDAVTSYLGFGVRFLQGPRRTAIAGHALGRILAPSVNAMFEWSDPVPGIRFVMSHLRHPRGLVRPFLVDVEVGDVDVSVSAS